MEQKRNNRWMPLIMALCVVAGIFIGTFYANHFSGNRLNIINSGSNRLNNLLHIIDDQYVPHNRISVSLNQRVLSQDNLTPILSPVSISLPFMKSSVRAIPTGIL